MVFPVISQRPGPETSGHRWNGAELRGLEAADLGALPGSPGGADGMGCMGWGWDVIYIYIHILICILLYINSYIHIILYMYISIYYFIIYI